MAGRNNRRHNERILKIILLIISSVSLVIGIACFTYSFAKSRSAAKIGSEEASEETVTESSIAADVEPSGNDITDENNDPGLHSDGAYVEAASVSPSEDGGAEETDHTDTDSVDAIYETLNDGSLTDDEKIALEEELKEREAAEADAASSDQKYSIDYIYGVFIASDPDVTRAFAPTIAFHKGNTFDLTLNFNDNMKTYKGSFTTSTKQNEMDDLYLYLTIDKPDNGISDSATVVFSDSSDYCLFMDEGFGLMGYSGAPYYFNRDERE